LIEKHLQPAGCFLRALTVSEFGEFFSF